MIEAVVDVGSGSVVTIVAEKNDQGWKAVRELSRVTRLGWETKTTGILAEDRMVATLEALREAKAAAENAGAASFRAYGTMATRIATNTAEFQARAADQGTPVTVLSGDQEAELGFLSVAEDPLFSAHDRISIIDPGGHSTELTTGTKTLHQPAGAVFAAESWAPEFQQSYPVGAIGLRETLAKSENPGPQERFMAMVKIDETLGIDWDAEKAGTVVALGATATNLITIREAMTEWDASRVHGQVLDYEEVSRSANWLMGMTDAERASITGIEPGREKTLHLGCLILERFMYALKAEQCVVSTRGWRWALLGRNL